MKNPDLIASTNPEARANPMIWEGEDAAEGVFLGTPDSDPLALLGTPSMEVPEAPRLPEDFAPSEALIAWLGELTAALAAAAEGRRCEITQLAALSELSIQAVVEILGAGEVTGAVTLDGVRYQITESVLAGVWRLEGDDGSHYVEVGSLPRAAIEAASSLERAPFEVPPALPGLMNAQPVLAEISERGAKWSEGDETHVINFTLLPMSEADQLAIRDTLGRAELELESGGFGNCRVFATRYRHVWAVQYLNALGHTILDTVEIGAPPGAVAAAREDFEDSSARLREILDTYLPGEALP